MTGKMKKLIVLIQACLIGLGTKVFARGYLGEPQPMYGVEIPLPLPARMLNLLGGVMIPICIMIGIITLFRKKKTKKQKAVRILVMIGIVIVIPIICTVGTNIIENIYYK